MASRRRATHINTLFAHRHPRKNGTYRSVEASPHPSDNRALEHSGPRTSSGALWRPDRFGTQLIRRSPTAFDSCVLDAVIGCPIRAISAGSAT